MVILYTIEAELEKIVIWHKLATFTMECGVDLRFYLKLYQGKIGHQGQVLLAQR